ncbi:MAG: AlpA family phage regulatory protein [Methylotenera sp.]|nr:AlpA family phage regulatory protein [Methylotenera sp.]
MNIDVSNLPNEALIRLPIVIALTGRKRSSIYNDISLNTFPRPVKIGARAVAFQLGEIREWINQKTLVSKRFNGVV